jgi:AcrR family transcriptional regulator
VTTGGRRSPDAEASRAALLRAARELFAERGFDRTTVRAIAERAGVNQALLFRYHGNKEALFAAAISEEAVEFADASAPHRLLEATLRRMLQTDEPDTPLFAALRSPGHAGALAALREEIGEPYRRAFASLTPAPGSPDAELRADLLLAWLLGIGFARAVVGTPSLLAADPEDLVAHVERAAARLLGSPSTEGPAPRGVE